MFLKISQSSQENTCARTPFFAEHIWATASAIQCCKGSGKRPRAIDQTLILSVLNVLNCSNVQ